MNRRTLLRAAGRLAMLGGIPTAASGLFRQARAAGDFAAPLLTRSYPDLQGLQQDLSQWKGRPMLVNFWATWCGPCVKEMPALDELHHRYNGVQFLGIAIDTTANVGKFVQKIPVSYQVLIAGPAGISLMRELGNGPGVLPFTVLIAADGGITERVLGPVDPHAMGPLLERLAG